MMVYFLDWLNISLSCIVDVGSGHGRITLKSWCALRMLLAIVLFHIFHPSYSHGDSFCLPTTQRNLSITHHLTFTDSAHL